MTLPHLVSRLLAGLLALHLLVAASGAAMGTGEMRMMQTPASVASSTADHEDPERTSSSEGAPCSADMACEMPMPNGCPSTLPCAWATPLPARLVSVALTALRSPSPALAPVWAPHTRLSPPELPPPRA
jgi:hypothetical protein